jgi:hypothetical protein
LAGLGLLWAVILSYYGVVAGWAVDYLFTLRDFQPARIKVPELLPNCVIRPAQLFWWRYSWHRQLDVLAGVRLEGQQDNDAGLFSSWFSGRIWHFSPGGRRRPFLFTPTGRS